MPNQKTLRKSSFLYAISILFTGIAAFAAIPIVKLSLGNAAYTQYNVAINAMLVVNIIGLGWLNQSVPRFGHRFAEQSGALLHLLRIFGISVLPGLGIGVFISIYLGLTTAGCILYLALIAVAGMQSLLLVWSQAQLKPQWYIWGEISRALILLLLLIAPKFQLVQPSMLYFFSALLISYLFEVGLLCYFARGAIKGSTGWQATRQQAGLLWHYGWPLSAWLAGNYLLFGMDRFFLLHFFSEEKLGDYLALNEVLIKGMGFLMSPLITAAYPLLSRMYDEGDATAARLLRKIGFVQLGLILLAIAGYFCFYPLAAQLLALPASDPLLFRAGLFVLLAAGLWQFGLLLQKKLELQKRTTSLLAAIAAAVFMASLLNLIGTHKYFILSASFAFTVGAMVYCGLILYFRRKSPILPIQNHTEI